MSERHPELEPDPFDEAPMPGERRRRVLRVAVLVALAAMVLPLVLSSVAVAHLEDDGATLFTEIRVSRGRLVNGLFYGLDGMRVGGTRRLELAPHMAYGDRGVPGIIPPSSPLVVEVTVLAAW